MKKNWRKFLSVLLAAAMVVTTYHVPSRAAGFDVRKDEIKDETFKDISSEAEDINVPKLGEQDEDPEELDKPDLSEVVRVSIILSAPSTVDAGYSIKNIASNSSAIAYRNSLKQNQAKVTAAIESVIGRKLDVKWNITLAANIISANVTRGDMLKIKLVDGVKDVVQENLYEAPIAEPNTSTSTGMIGADSVAWANGYYGAGSKIMIIDTGTNQDHISFDPDALEYALTLDGKSLDDYDLLTQAKVAELAGQLNVTIDPAQAYKNTKIPYAYNYVDGGYTTDHSADDQGEHGSHVSGIAAANRFVKSGNGFEEALTSVLACGVAPDAQILTAKVFGAGGGAYDSDYFVAIEDAIILGCDAVNLSLGSAVVGFSFSDGYQDIMDSLVEKGLIMVNSAGNSYHFSNSGTYTTIPYNYVEDVNMATGGSPGSFINTISTASADNVGVTGTPLIYNGTLPVFFNETYGYGNPEIATIAGTYDYVFINGYGYEEEYAAVNEVVPLEGKIVMVFRGDISFYVKGNNAIPYNPKAVVIVNNQAGTINMNLTGYTGTFPMVSITYDNGVSVAMASSYGTTEDGIAYFTGSVEVTDTLQSATVADAAAMSDFSSWGGNGSLKLKPEITAPGGDIYSVNGMTNDGYESMSGTSMAAPHMTGMAALFGEYYRDALKEYVDAAFPEKEFTERQLFHSLMMSTAEPLIEADSDTYYPVIRQGSGLANIGNAVTAKSFIMMEDDATVSAADGKVKAELGQSTEGKYSYSFTIYNPSAEDLIYDLRTDLITQDIFSYNDLLYMDTWAADMDGDISYSFPLSTTVHDVDQDGDTDVDDAQAILDSLTGERDAAELDLTVADLDKDEEITSRDAYLLLQFLYSLNGEEEDADTVLVPAGQSKTVNVTIDVSSWSDYLDYFTSGMWVEGYTFVTCKSISDDGEILEVEHSIPILGFFGSFTESSMFDANSLVGTLYGNPKKAYAGVDQTNYMLVKYNGEAKATAYTINPYAVDDEFPEGRQYINSKSVISGFHYDLIRAAGTTAVAAIKVEDGELTDEILSLSMGPAKYPDYYHVNQGQWMFPGRGNVSASLNAADLGLKEGDSFYVGYYAIPEYYAMQMNGPDGRESTLTEEQFRELLFNTDSKLQLGSGASIGYVLTIDDTRPVIEPAEINEETGEVTITYSDDNYVAYVAMMDPSASKEYAGFAPNQAEAGETLTFTFNKEDYTEMNAVVVFVADYAGNESAVVIRTGDGEILAEQSATIFVPADELEEGEEYLISRFNEEGETGLVYCYGSGYKVPASAALIESGEFPEYEGQYISADYVYTANLWEFASTDQYIADSYVIYNNYYDESPVYLFNNGGTPATFGVDVIGNSLYYGMMWCFGEDGLLSPYYEVYMVYDDESGFFTTAEEGEQFYLYKPMEVTMIGPYDPFTVSSVSLDPTAVTLIPSIGMDSVQLTATVLPITAEDRSLTWTSSDEAVATVDANGFVTATGLGVATITAEANDGSGQFATAVISVVEQTPIDASVKGQIGKTDGTVQFVEIDLNDMSSTVLYEAGEIKNYPFYGGGRGGRLIWGNDNDDDLHIFDVEDDFAYEYQYTLNSDYGMRDGANFPLTDYNGTLLQMASVTNAGYFAMMSYEGKITYFDLLSYGFDLVAITYIGTEEFDIDEDEKDDIVYFYYTLDTEGVLYLWYLYQTEEGWSGDLLDIGTLSGISMGEDKTAFSLSYAAAATGLDALFLADNNNKAVWFVDLSEVGDEPEPIPVTYVGSIDGIVSISTLYDDVFDADGDAGFPEALKARLGAVGAGLQLDAKTVVLEKAAPVEEPAEEVTEAPEEVTEAPAEETEEPAEEAEEPAEEAEEPAEEAEEPAEEAEEPAEEAEEPAEEAEEPAEEAEEPAEEAEEPAEEAEEPAEPTEEEPEVPAEEDPEAFGALNVVTAVENKAAVDKGEVDPNGVAPSTEPKSISLAIAEDMNVNNGFLTITYDPEKLAFDGILEPSKAGADLEDLFTSVSVDEEAGVITFAYASQKAVEAGTTLLEAEFVICETGEVVIATSERNEELDLEEEAVLEFEGKGHGWKFVDFTWTGNDEDGYTAASANFVCKYDDSHVTSVDAEITVETVEATSTSTGLVTYTATVSANVSPDGKEYSETKEVVISSTEATFELDKDSLTIPVGQSEQLTLVGSDGSVGFGTWTSSNEKIATVDSEGCVTALKYGKTTIHVVMENGYEADCEVQTLFSDVTNSKKYYYNAVYWAADHKPAITQGYDGEYFGVGQACERKDFILFLYRLEGQPKVTDAEVEEIKSTFSDLPDSGLSKTFLKAISWGYKTGVIKGYTSGELKGQFGYARTITRREAILMIWRAAGKPEAAETDLFKSFTDVIGTYKASTDTYKSIMWSVDKGISKGYIDQVNLPDETEYVAPCFGCDLDCKREDLIVFLYRMDNLK